MDQVNDIGIDVTSDKNNQRIVQEVIEEMEVKFTPTTIIPGTTTDPKNRQGAKIKFPIAFSGTSGLQITATWDGQSASIQRDTENECAGDFVCYIVWVSNQNEITASEHTLVLKNALINPISVNKISVFGNVGVKTMLGSQDSGSTIVWSDISTGDVASEYTAKIGTIESGSIVPAPPKINVAKGITETRVSAQTYAANQILDVEFTPKHSVPTFGFVLVRFIENTFIFSDTGTATANYDIFKNDAETKLGVFQEVFNPGENDVQCNAGLNTD